MPYESLETLYDCYPEIVDEMPQVFDSHQFILKLAEKHQRQYVEALYDLRDSQRDGRDVPFMALHSALAQQLAARPDLVAPDGREESRDIFGNPNEAARWRKVG